MLNFVTDNQRAPSSLGTIQELLVLKLSLYLGQAYFPEVRVDDFKHSKFSIKFWKLIFFAVFISVSISLPRWPWEHLSVRQVPRPGAKLLQFSGFRNALNDSLQFCFKGVSFPTILNVKCIIESFQSNTQLRYLQDESELWEQWTARVCNSNPQKCKHMLDHA